MGRQLPLAGLLHVIGAMLLTGSLICNSVPEAYASGSSVTHSVDQEFARYWRDKERGWFWYEDPLLEVRKKPSPPTKPGSGRNKTPELVEMERLQKEVDDLRKVAIIRPTESNVRRYMELEAKVIRMASDFSEMTRRVAWTNPELDPSWQGRPSNPKALEIHDREEMMSRARLVSEMAQDHVIFFFFRGDCPYCHAYAPTLAQFEKTFGIQIVPISLDGGTLAEFPNPRMDNGISTTLKVSTVPATYIANPLSGKITAIGAGVLTDRDLLERLALVGSPETSERLPGAAKRLPIDFTDTTSPAGRSANSLLPGLE